MKRILAALLILCLALPLCAGATRTRITSYTEVEWDAVNAVLLSLDDRVQAEGIGSLTADERLLYIAISYNGLMLSGGLVSVMLYMEPEEVADIPAALRFVGAEEHAARFEAFMAETGCSPAALNMLEFLGPSLIRALYPIDPFDDAFIALDEEHALTTLIFHNLPTIA
ncbi:MAG: hypothetical protein IJE07_05955 [Clostridia bacterium]|nr:hypothetical protein [Clostridia bacterium]